MSPSESVAVPATFNVVPTEIVISLPAPFTVMWTAGKLARAVVLRANGSASSTIVRTTTSAADSKGTSRDGRRTRDQRPANIGPAYATALERAKRFFAGSIDKNTLFIGLPFSF